MYHHGSSGDIIEECFSIMAGDLAPIIGLFPITKIPSFHAVLVFPILN